MNSTPMDSNAAWIASTERALPDGTPVINSNRLIVATPTPDLEAKSLAVTLISCLAALICSEVINLTIL